MPDNIWSPHPTDELLPDEQTIVVEVDADGANAPDFDEKTGTLTVPTADGGVDVTFGVKPDDDTGFDDNLAERMGEGELTRIAYDLIQGIEADDKSRADWISQRERGIDLLGTKLEDPQGDVGASSAPLEGQARTRHPILLEAVLRAQATACGELLPAGGPVKVEVIGEASEDDDRLAEALEADLNDYLTNVAKEYYPDTRRTLYWSSFGGSGFKKVFNCPMRRRPVSESVDAGDLIISAGATDLTNAQRVTHRIVMMPSRLKRMQFAKIYRDVDLGQPISEPSQLDQKMATVQGLSVRIDRPEDQPYTIYECYCELDLDEFAPKPFKGKGVPLPYRVTLDKDSKQVLEIRRNWNEDDPQAMPRKAFVKYPYVEAQGIYGLGLLHILGNATTALTAAWRIMLDNGMFANFPGFIVDKSASRQLTNEFRVPPGGAVQLDFGGRPSSNIVAQLPYRNLDATYVQFIGNVQDTSQRLGGAADLPVGEGRQDAPVGTTVALVESQTKIISEVHKGLHSAQAEEFDLLADRFREDPGAMFRHNPKSKTLKIMMAQKGLQAFADEEDKAAEQRAELFLAALERCNIVPVADPNTPTHIHRLMRVQGLIQLVQTGAKLDQDKVTDLAVRALGYDPQELVPPPQPEDPEQNPDLLASKAKLMASQAALIRAQNEAKAGDQEAQMKLLELQQQYKIAQLDFQREQVIHGSNLQQAQLKVKGDLVTNQMKLIADSRKHAQTLAANQQQHSQTIAADIYKHHNDMLHDNVQQLREHAHQRQQTLMQPMGQPNDQSRKAGQG